MAFSHGASPLTRLETFQIGDRGVALVNRTPTAGGRGPGLRHARRRLEKQECEGVWSHACSPGSSTIAASSVTLSLWRLLRVNEHAYLGRSLSPCRPPPSGSSTFTASPYSILDFLVTESVPCW